MNPYSLRHCREPEIPSSAIQSTNLHMYINMLLMQFIIIENGTRHYAIVRLCMDRKLLLAAGVTFIIIVTKYTSTGIDAGASKGRSWPGYSWQQSGSMLKNVGYWFQVLVSAELSQILRYCSSSLKVFMQLTGWTVNLSKSETLQFRMRSCIWHHKVFRI